VQDAIRVELDILGYINGAGYELEIIQVADSLGNPPMIFGVSIPILESESRLVDFVKVINLFQDDKGNYLRLCLADLREAIREARDTGFFLYRAIESLMQSFRTEDDTKGKEKAWQSLRSELSVSEDIVRRLEKVAKSFRHGETRYMSDAEKSELFTITWDIVDRYIKYACNGYQK
jgi:ribonucleotide reductase beta subunit family protein with ferritin-like domain